MRTLKNSEEKREASEELKDKVLDLYDEAGKITQQKVNEAAKEQAELASERIEELYHNLLNALHADMWSVTYRIKLHEALNIVAKLKRMNI